MTDEPTLDERGVELQRLRERLAEAEETLRAISAGEVDALIIDQGSATPAVYTLKNADSPYRLLVEQMGEGAVTLSADGTILYSNGSLSRMLGIPSEQLRGLSFKSLLVENSATFIDTVIPSGRSSLSDLRLRTNDGGIRHVYISSSPLVIDGDAVHCLVVTDLTMHGLRVRHDAIVNSSSDAIYSVAADGKIATWNAAAETLFGYTSAEIVGQSAALLIPATDVERLGIPETFDGQKSKPSRDVVRVGKGGRRVDVAVSVSPMVEATGHDGGLSVIARDIAERLEAERHMLFLLRETSHRSKNLLAIIQSIAAQTVRSGGSIETFETTFMQRLQALSASHDIFVEENWQRASLEELIVRHTRPFVAGVDRLRVVGSPVYLRPEAAQNIGFALHELATNATKYGAWSGREGHVDISWKLFAEGEVKKLHLNWREQGGPKVRAPTKTGFGTSVIRTLVATSLDGEVATSYFPDGFQWDLIAPADPMIVRSQHA